MKHMENLKSSDDIFKETGEKVATKRKKKLTDHHHGYSFLFHFEILSLKLELLLLRCYCRGIYAIILYCGVILWSMLSFFLNLQKTEE